MQEWTIERLVPGGEGMARLPGGRIAFVRGAFPGDRIRALELAERPDFVRATRWTLERPGPSRVEPFCAVADRCGGCDWIRLGRRAQVDAKLDLILQALRRTGGFGEVPGGVRVDAGGAHLGYRIRLRVHFGPQGQIGLFARESHQVIDLCHCPVALGSVNEALATLRRVNGERPGALRPLADLELRAAPAGPRLAASPTFDGAHRRAGPARAALLALGECGFVLPGELTGQKAEDPQRFPLPTGVELFAFPATFTQVNWEMNTRLVAAVLEGAKQRGVRCVGDLYAGAGNFSLPLLKVGLEVHAVERSPSAVRAAKAAARNAGLSATAFKSEDVPRAVARWQRQRRRFDLLVLDPPRTGARAAVQGILELAPRHIALCSCDPVTLARDLKELTGGGYELIEVEGFDMFPHTHHVEAIAWLERRRETGEPRSTRLEGR